MYVFEGKRLLFSHKDPATGSHADLQQILQLATSGEPANGEDCGCDAPTGGSDPSGGGKQQ
jgi:hypothetical protein